MILRRIEPGQSLLEVAMDHAVPLKHDCGGMCACGTCHVYLHEGNDKVEFKSKREMHRLEKIPHADSSSRLACQCVLLPGRGNLVVTLPAVIPAAE